MTVEEFYKWCKERNVMDFKLVSNEISINGCFIGYEEVTPERTDISCGESIVYV